MRIEIEQRPVDSKILRDNFRKGIERKMNKLALKGYVPVGGISSHMNTQTKPVLGIDVHEFTQTMVKYENVEIWVKESDSDRQAFSDELALQNIVRNISKCEKEIKKWSRFLEPSQQLIAKARKRIDLDNYNPTKKSFFGNMKRNRNLRNLAKLESKFKELKVRISKSELQLSEFESQKTDIDMRLHKFYLQYPSLTKEGLLASH